jgi:hypothetical protein
MALIKCHECGNEVSDKAKTCPKCGATPKTTTNKLTAIGGGIIAILAIWYFFGGGLEQQAGSDMQKLVQQVASDTIKQYDMAKRSGNAIDVCAQAGMVSAAFLQAKDDVNYQAWKKVEKADCRKAGM